MFDTQPMFAEDIFRDLARQFRDMALDYAALRLDAPTAAAWANHGFTPDEAADWIRAEFDPCTASAWANRFISVNEAVRRRNWGESGRITSQPCKACAPTVAEYVSAETAYGQTTRFPYAIRVF